jgi:uncharacterized protein
MAVVNLMQYRKLGIKGPEVSALGFGCMRLPVIDGDAARIDEPAATRLLHAAIEQGVNYVDTAWPYHEGNSEPWLGRALRGGYRDKVFLATKLPSWAIESRADCDRYLAEQLARLQTRHLDLYLLHCLKKDWWEKLKGLGVLEFLDGAIRDGRIRYAGFSFHDEYPVFEEILRAYDWSFCQVQFNFMDDELQAGTRGVRLASQRGLGVVAMEPLRGGNLAKPMAADVQALCRTMHPERPLVEWALRWVWDFPEVSVALTSMSEAGHLEQNLRLAGSAQARALSREELSLIRSVKQKLREKSKAGCTACNYCLPCPSGVAIPKVLSYYNDRHLYDDRKSAVIGYNFLLRPDEQASACTECGECEKLCPQQLPIRQLLQASHLELAAP